LGHTRKTAAFVLVAGLLVALLVSCGEDNGTGPKCVNCDFWSKAFGRVGRFPSVSPTDPHLIAFVSSDTTAGCTSVGYDHLWIARLPELEGEDINYYQITCDAYYDFEPAWSPDGNTIAFERNFGGSRSDIFTVDVTNIDAPGTPVQFTDRTVLPISNESPAWVVIGGDTYVVFSNVSAGGNDYDLMMYHYPDRGAVIPLTIDPADFAQNENGVLSYMFKDQQVCANGSDVLAFTSPDRMKVCDIRVVARSRETFPDTTAAATILINSKDSGRTTPYTFRYRPAVAVIVEGALQRYCTNPIDTLDAAPGVTNTCLLEFEYKQGTVGFRSDPGVKYVYMDGKKIEGFVTDPIPAIFTYANCVAVGSHSAYAVFTSNEEIRSPTVSFEVAAGETALVDLVFSPMGALSAGAAGLGSGLATPPARVAMSSAAAQYGVWVIDMQDQTSLSDELTYQAFSSASSLGQPAISPDGKYVAYLVGDGVNRQIGVSDLSSLTPDGPWPQPVIIGLPGSDEDVECWRIPERVEWLPAASGRKIVASISVCRGGDVAEDFEVWIADLSGFLE